MSRTRKRTFTPATPKAARTITDHGAYTVAAHMLATVELPSVNQTNLLYSAQQWVNYGENNGFPSYLIECSKKAAVHSSIIATRQNLLKGEGFSYSDELEEFFTTLDEDGLTLEELYENCVNDLSVLETCGVMVRYNAMKDKIIHLDYVDSSYIRPDKNLTETGKIKGYWVCIDWQNTTRNVPVYYEAFNPNKVEETSQLYFYHKRGLGQPFLPDVSYAAALMHIELAYQIAHYGFNTVLQGFFPSGILNVKGSMSPDQKEEYQRKIKKHLQGAERAGSVLINISEDIDNIRFESLTPADNSAIFSALQKLSLDAICTAHRANPIIAAIQTDGSTLGSDGKLYRDSLQIYQNTVIKDLKKPFLNFLLKVVRFNGYKEAKVSIADSALLANEVPEWFLTSFVKPEVLASMFGFQSTDLISQETIPQDSLDAHQE